MILFKERHCMSAVWCMRYNYKDNFLESGLSFKVGWVCRGPYKMSILK